MDWQGLAAVLLLHRARSRMPWKWSADVLVRVFRLETENRADEGVRAPFSSPPCPIQKLLRFLIDRAARLWRDDNPLFQVHN